MRRRSSRLFASNATANGFGKCGLFAFLLWLLYIIHPKESKVRYFVSAYDISILTIPT
jgi:hypothetical protein